ncbi:hypothetical protein J5N97_013634 [Dioscorea zingiberensis]|uniref:Uncharacterized protein n=1 Tax=Dioscorea zingiberensis TaxID=325984 RepID=A0A9D5CTP0_9LILI|nr:hypothetical protein J5N97_013634 [Dioscorea zingiberensis]
MPRSILPSMSLTLASNPRLPQVDRNPLITGLTSSSLSRVVGTALAASLSVLRTLSSTRTRATPDVRAVIPLSRADLHTDRGVSLSLRQCTASSPCSSSLLQTEYGDIFKATLEHDNDRVSELKIKYFDTIPVTSAMCVLKTGFLFAASEVWEPRLYQFRAIGDGDDVEASSATLMETEEGFQPLLLPAPWSQELDIECAECVLSLLSPSCCWKCRLRVGGEGMVLDHPASVFLNAGLQNGVLFRTVVDMITGQLSDTRSRFLGLRVSKLFSAIVRGRRAMLCLSKSSLAWLYSSGHFLLTPLSYETLEYAASFSSDQCAEGVVAVAGDALRVFTIERLGETLNETSIPLKIYSPQVCTSSQTETFGHH